MTVNLQAPQPADVLAVPGVRLGIVQAGVRKVGRKDLTVILLDEGSAVSGVFTQNRYCAAPVQVCRHHLQQVNPSKADTQIRALLINTGNANAGTGAQGERDAIACCEALARQCGVKLEQVLPFSTGVIGELLPVTKIIDALPDAHRALADDQLASAARGIMTTDTRPKLVSRRVLIEGHPVTISGIAKGSGMI